jgi:hypothetical protein
MQKPTVLLLQKAQKRQTLYGFATGARISLALK